MSLNPISTKSLTTIKMKISKIIFISLLSVIALIILSSVLYIRITGYKIDDINNINVFNQTLPPFKVLCIKNCSNIKIVESDTMSISSTCPKDSLFSKDFIITKPDTLILSNAKEYIKIKLSINNTLKNINVHESDITIISIPSSVISINVDKSELYFNIDKPKNYVLKTLTLNAKNHSRVSSNFFKIDSLNINLLKSHSNLGLYAKNICVTMADSSGLYTKQPEQLTMKRDTSSTFYLFNYK